MPELAAGAKWHHERYDGKGTQFDPKFADIMLKMIDDDRDYVMRDKPVNV